MTQGRAKPDTLIDNAAFTDGASEVSPAGFILDETAGTALTENDVAASRIDSKRAQVMVIEDTTIRGRRVTVTAANALKVDNSGVVQTITGTITGDVNVIQPNAAYLQASVRGQNAWNSNSYYYNEYPVLIGAVGYSSPTTEIVPVSGGGYRTSIATDPYGQLMVTTDPNSLPSVNVSTVLNPITANISGAVSITKTPLTMSAPTSASIGTSTTNAVASNASRKGLILKNLSANRISLVSGAGTATLDAGITLYPGESWTMGEYDYTTAQIRAIASGASSTLAIQEFV